MAQPVGMVNACRPLRESGGLPPRRSELIQAAAAAVPSGGDWGSSINVPLARDRMLDYFEREQLPGDVRNTLQAALNGDLHYQHLLFTAMIDTWPKLQKAVEEIARKVSCAPWKVHPYAERGEKPTPKAEKDAKEVEAFIWGMKPHPARMENGLEDTIKALVRGYYYGHAVCEIRWENKDGWRPRATKTIPARFYGYPYDAATAEDPEDRLMFDPSGMQGRRAFEDFPENRFLIAIHTGHAGHPAMAAPLRALAGYWLAAVYGLKWFMNFTQLYGIPWRHIECADEKDGNALDQAMSKFGANGWIRTKPGNKINILSPGSTSAASLPQRELIALADQQCDQFILGQTLTSGTDNSGSRALGEVHQGTLDGVVDGVADFVGGVLTHQLIPAIVAANWGGSMTDMPELWAKREEVKDEKALAERDEKIGITTGKVPVSKAWFYERHGIPAPTDGDELLIEEPEPEADPFSQPPPDGVQGDPATEDADASHETKGGKGIPVPKKKLPVEAADATVKDSLTVDQLSTAVLEGLTGVSREWLSPVRPFFDRLAALAMSKQVTDDDFLAALEKAQTQLPEIFDLMDSQALEDAFSNAIGSAALAGSVSRYQP